MGIFNKTNILLTFVGYEVSTANRAYGTSLATAIFWYPTRVSAIIIKYTEIMFNYDSNQENSFCTILQPELNNLYMRIYCNTFILSTSKHNNNNKVQGYMINKILFVTYHKRKMYVQ